MEEYVINPRFQNALPSLTEEEFKQLENNIVSEGKVRDALVVWGKTIVDGHNRWKIIQKHPEVSYTTEQVEFADEWEAIEWMCKKQLGQRNLTTQQKTYTLGKLYEARKNTHGGDRRSQDFSSRQIDGMKSERTDEIVAREQGVDPRTVDRAYLYSKAVDKGEEDVPGFREAVVLGQVKVSKDDIRNLNKLDDEERKEAVQTIMRGEKPEKEATPYVQPTEMIEIGNAPYDEQNFEDQISNFPKEFDDSIRLFLLAHGDMLKKAKCKAAFRLMLKDAEEVIKKYKEVIKNEY